MHQPALVGVRGSRVAHVRQACRPRAFTEMLALASGAEGSVPSPTPRPGPWSSSELGRIRRAPEKTAQQHHSGWGPWLQEAQADSHAHAAVSGLQLLGVPAPWGEDASGQAPAHIARTHTSDRVQGRP